MAMPKLISHAVSTRCLAVGLATLASTAGADTTTIGLLNPVAVPQDQGWRLIETVPGALPIVAYGPYIHAHTVSTQGPPANSVQLFHRQIPILVQDGYTVDFWLKVEDVQTPHNAFDAALALYASTTNPDQYSFTGGPRDQLIYFDEDAIGWGDDSDSFAMDTTDNFHHYRVEVDSSGNAHVLVDGQLALQKSNFKAYPHVAFGDMTNDQGLESSFSVSGLTVSGLLTAPVPVDVRPSDCPNRSLDGRSTKSIPIAIAGDLFFNVANIDPTTVRVNGLAPRAWSIRDAARPLAPFLGKEHLDQCTTAGSDGRPDLVLAFEERGLVAALGPVTTGRPVTLRVTAKLKPEFGLQGIAGEDVVVVSVPSP